MGANGVEWLAKTGSGQEKLKGKETNNSKTIDRSSVVLFCFVFRFAQELSNSEGNILENKALLLSLDETKAKSMDITTKLAESAELQISLNQQVIRTNLFSLL